MALIKPDQERMNARYLEYYLRSNYGQKLIARGVNQSSQGNIFLTQIEALPITVPNIATQRQFATIVAEYEQTRHQQQESARQSDHLFDTLLHRAFISDLGSEGNRARDGAWEMSEVVPRVPSAW